MEESVESVVAGEKLAGDLLIVRYVRLDQVELWDENPKLHDTGGIIRSIKRHGFRDAPIYDETLGALVAGNGRAHALRVMLRSGEAPPIGIAVGGDGMWYMPVQFGVNAPSIEAAEAFGVDHNNLTLTGGDLTLFDMARMWDEEGYKELLKKIADAGDLLVSMDMDDIDLYLKGGIEFADAASSEHDSERVTGSITLKLMVEDRDQAPLIADAIRSLLEEHVEWKAHLEKSQ